VPTSAHLEWVLPLFLAAELVQRLQTSSMLVVGAVGGGVAYLSRALPMNGGVLLATLLAGLLNRLNLTRFIWHPPLFFVALAVVCTRLVGLFIIPI